MEFLPLSCIHVGNTIVYLLSSLPPPPLSPDTADKAEASLMLHSISELREHQPEEKSVNRNGALPLYHTLALLHTVLEDKEKVSFSQSEDS